MSDTVVRQEASDGVTEFLARLPLLKPFPFRLNTVLRAARDAGWQQVDLAPALGISPQRVHDRVFAGRLHPGPPCIPIPPPNIESTRTKRSKRSKELAKLTPAIIEAYKGGATLNQVGKQFGRSRSTISWILDKHGIKRRPRPLSKDDSRPVAQARPVTEPVIWKDGLTPTIIVRQAVYESSLSQAEIARRSLCNESELSRIMRNKRPCTSALVPSILRACGLELTLSARPLNNTAVTTPTKVEPS